MDVIADKKGFTEWVRNSLSFRIFRFFTSVIILIYVSNAFKKSIDEYWFITLLLATFLFVLFIFIWYFITYLVSLYLGNKAFKNGNKFFISYQLGSDLLVAGRQELLIPLSAIKITETRANFLFYIRYNEKTLYLILPKRKKNDQKQNEKVQELMNSLRKEIEIKNPRII